MNHVEIFQQLLTQYGEAIDLPDLMATSEGFCALTIDDSFVLKLQLDTEAGLLAFVIELGRVEEEYRAKTGTFILAANVLWMGTGGATLGMDFEGLAVLCYSESVAHMAVERFSKIIDGIISVAEDWEENFVALRLDDVGPEALAQEWGSSDPGFSFGIKV